MALLSQYGFNEGSGLVSADSSGNGLDLVAFHTTTSWDAGGKNGAGARSEHTGVVGPSASQIEFTVMLWVKRTNNWSGWAAAFGNDNGSAHFLIESLSSDSYSVNWFGDTASITSSTLLDIDVWVHVAVVRENDGTGRLFINGSQEDVGTPSVAQNFGTDVWYAAGGDVSVNGGGGEDAYFEGVVDELRVFDNAMDGTEITTWMNTPIGATDTGLAWIKA